MAQENKEKEDVQQQSPEMPESEVKKTGDAASGEKMSGKGAKEMKKEKEKEK